MNKRKELVWAGQHLNPTEYKEYAEWLDKPWVERYPYLTTLILHLSLAVNIILLVNLLET